MSTFERLPTIIHAVFLPIHYSIFRVKVFRLGNWLRYYRTKEREREREREMRTKTEKYAKTDTKIKTLIDKDKRYEIERHILK